MQHNTLQNLINNYINNNGPENLAEYLLSILKQEQDIKNRIIKLHKEMRQEEESHKKILEAQRIELGTIQIECPHWEVKYYGDPAGGSDSYSECTLCGKEW